MMDHAGVRLLRLIGLGNIDQMHHRLASEYIHAPGKAKFGRAPPFPGPGYPRKTDRVGEVPGPDVE